MPQRDDRQLVLTVKTLTTLAMVLAPALVAADDWTQFRGQGGRGVAAGEQSLPLEWNVGEDQVQGSNVAWRVDLPGRGPSSPIVVEGRVFVTCSSGYDQDRLHVLGFDAKTGMQLWERQFWATGRTKSHPSSANAAPTPASDGQAIYAFYSSNDLICLDLDGNLRWYRGLAYDFPKAGNDVGMSSSPVVSDGAVIVQIENQGDSFVAAIETADGQTRWRIDRPRQANWSSPVIVQTPAGEPLVLVKSAEGVDAHELRGGLQRWTYPVNADGISSIATSPGQVYLPAEGVTRLEVFNAGTAPQVRWTSDRIRPGSASPIVSDDRLFAINSAGVLICGDLQDGKVLWQLRLQGTFWSTPVLVGNHLYCINEVGLAQVVDVNGKGEIVGTSDFSETIQGSPAVSNGSLYVRSDKSLWRIAAPEQADIGRSLR